MNNQSSKRTLLLFVLFFALAGGIALFKSFASASLKIEAENMKLAKYAKSVDDKSAEGKKAVTASRVKRGYHLTGNLNSNKTLKSISLRAKATPCGTNQYPTATIYIKTASQRPKVLSAKISSTKYKNYSAKDLNLTTSNSKFEVQVYYSTYSKTKKCNATIYFDNIKFSGGGAGGGSSSSSSGGGSHNPPGCTPGSNCDGDPCSYPKVFKNNKCVSPPPPGENVTVCVPETGGGGPPGCDSSLLSAGLAHNETWCYAPPPVGLISKSACH